MFAEPLAQSLPSLLWSFLKLLCQVLCVVNNLCCGVGVYLVCVKAYVRIL
jgi:hypothetical protein